ncbi:hypothetical protein SAMN05444373_104016 [Thermoclostridium caenicola]|uniref:Uncharacterized protein n=1 Tax=Thermoclostridium caenicola TaxID=659425 RepID=A0A1M6IA99_9FIRM|nr:hypothetical protein SAMN05444373_104016 [Thermoclostridium caenicola]
MHKKDRDYAVIFPARWVNNQCKEQQQQQEQEVDNRARTHNVNLIILTEYHNKGVDSTQKVN